MVFKRVIAQQVFYLTLFQTLLNYDMWKKKYKTLSKVFNKIFRFKLKIKYLGRCIQLFLKS